jgi:hypothetical protein
VALKPLETSPVFHAAGIHRAASIGSRSSTMMTPPSVCCACFTVDARSEIRTPTVAVKREPRRPTPAIAATADRE